MTTVIHDLAHDRHGDPAGPPLVFLHGLSGARTSWQPVAPAFGDHDVHVIDHRGHGESPRAPSPDQYTVADYTADAVAYLEREVGRPATVVGHSLGGLVAAQLGATRPDLVSGLFLEDPPLLLGDPDVFGTTLFAEVFPAARDGLRMFRDLSFTEDAIYEAIRNLPDMSGAGTMEEVQGAEATREQARTWHRFDPEAYTPAIEGTLWSGYDPTVALQIPVVVLRAERELGAAFFEEHAEPFLSANPHASIELIAGASHLIHDDRLDEFTARLAKFLDEIEHR